MNSRGKSFRHVCTWALGVAALLPLSAGAESGEVLTGPWLQNVYTNRVTVMCETLAQMEGLAVQADVGHTVIVPMVCTNGLKEGTFVYRAELALKPGELTRYALVTNGFGVADTDGEVMPWQDGDAAFTCAIWGDNQEGVQEYDWGFEDTFERYRCIHRMFDHLVAQRPDFGFTTGDMSSAARYDEEILPGELRGLNDRFGSTLPYHLVWGNHDCNGTFFGEVYTNAVQRYFTPAEPESAGCFHFYRNDVLFIGVHWTWGDEDAERRYDQITNDIARLLATERAKQAKFRLLFQHAPIFLECYNVLPKLDWFSDARLMDVARQGGVDIVFSGHTHAYERIERHGLVQVVNGGMGYLDHGERWYNNYGSDTQVGGHRNTPLLWARQNETGGALAAAEPVRMGCFQGYGLLSVTNNTLTYRAHAFNADGSYIGVADSFTLKSKTAPEPTLPPAKTPSVSIALDLGRPIDNAAWAAFKTAVGEKFEYDPFHAHDPVVNVSKTEIERFCAALNADGLHHYRLPTVKELTAIFGGDLRREISEWTADIDPNSRWCRILGGNRQAVDYTWCREFDQPAMASPDCHANYLGFRLVDAVEPAVVETPMDRALAALAAIETPAEVYQWNPLKGELVDITADWKGLDWLGNYDYLSPVIFTGTGELKYHVRKPVVFGGGLAAPNATSLDLSPAPDLKSKPITVKGEFRGGVAASQWRFFLKCDELTLDGVTYRGQVFNAVTGSRALQLVGTNDFSGAVMSVGVDHALPDPAEDFVTNLVADAAAQLRLRRLDFSVVGVFAEVLGWKTAGFTVGRNVTLVTAEDVLFGIKGATLAVDGALDAAGIDIAGHLMGLLPQEANVIGAGAVRTTHFGMCDKSTLNLGVAGVTLLSAVPYRTYTACTNGCNVRWTQTFPIEFNAWGGVLTNAQATMTCGFGATEGYALPAVRRRGYALRGWFLGWQEDAAEVTNGQRLAVTQPHSVYAQWDATGDELLPGGIAIADTVHAVPKTAITTADGYAGSETLTEVVTPVYLQRIGDEAFSGCGNLRRVTLTATRDYATGLPSPLTIGARAFADTLVEDVVIPAECAELSQSAFTNCPALRSVSFLGSNTVVNARAFRDCGFGGSELRLYASGDFLRNHPGFATAVQAANPEAVVMTCEDLLRPAWLKCEAIEVGGGETVRLTLAAVTSAAWADPDLTNLKVYYRPNLAAVATPLDCEAVTFGTDGRVTVTVTFPAGATGGFFIAVVD